MSIWLHAWKEPGKWFHQSSTQKHLFTWEPRPACGCSGMAACWDWARLGVGLGCTRASELWANATLLLNTILEMLNIHTEERKCQWTDNIPKVFECIIMGVYTCKKKKKPSCWSPHREFKGVMAQRKIEPVYSDIWGNRFSHSISGRRRPRGDHRCPKTQIVPAQHYWSPLSTYRLNFSFVCSLIDSVRSDHLLCPRTWE